MNKLIEKLNKQGFDVTDDLQFNNITLARRRESFNWYVYVSKHTGNMNEVRESLEYPSIPLLWLTIQPDEVFDDVSNWKRNDYPNKITEYVIPESWLIPYI